MNGMRGRVAVFAMAAAGVGLLAAALALLDHLGRDYVVDALAPIATIPEQSPQSLLDDALPQGEASYLPVPPPLDDERVVDALAPIANVACRREDAPTPASKAPNRSQLDAPLGSVFIAGIAPSASAC